MDANCCFYSFFKELLRHLFRQGFIGQRRLRSPRDDIFLLLPSTLLIHFPDNSLYCWCNCSLPYIVPGKDYMTSPVNNLYFDRQTSFSIYTNTSFWQNGREFNSSTPTELRAWLCELPQGRYLTAGDWGLPTGSPVHFILSFYHSLSHYRIFAFSHSFTHLPFYASTQFLPALFPLTASSIRLPALIYVYPSF